jgi:hypothetical protein
MLNNVPEAVNRMTRNIVINHPNSYNVIVFRKRVLRPADNAIGGLPTLGGLAVISSDDEEDITWDLLGDGYALESESYTPGVMMDRQDANDGGVQEFRFLIEPEILDGLPGGFSVKKNDVMYLIIDEVRLAFEVVAIETTSNIPPYTQRYICNRRDDLHTTVVE